MYKFKFADIGEGLHEGVVAEIFKKEGDAVKEGDSLFSVETDKVTSDIPSPVEGTVSKVLMTLGDTIHVGDVVYEINDGSGDSAPTEKEVKEEAPAEESAASVVGDIKVSNELFSFDMFKNPNTKKAGTKTETNNKEVASATDFDIDSIKPVGNGEQVDVVVIGGGPAGYKAASSLAKAGLKVISVEKAAFGGTCTNTGCIPVKVLLKTTKTLKTLLHSHEYGIEFDQKTIKPNLDKIMERRHAVSKQLAAGAEMVVKSSKATIVKGEAKIIDRYNVEVNDKKFTTKVIMIATGAKPMVIDLPGFEKGYKDGHVITSTEALSLTKLPKTLTVIGGHDDGGPTIDVNFSKILSDVGVKVTLIKPTPSVIMDFDTSMQKHALESLESSGVKVILNAEVKELKGKELIYVVDGKEQKVKSDAILAAKGRTIDNDNIQLELARDARGFIETNNKFVTKSFDNVFAIGDVTGKYMLAHEGFKHGIVAAAHILKEDISYRQELMPKTSYVDPEIAFVGFTEQQLKDKGIKYIAAEWAQAFEGKSVADGDIIGGAKVLIGQEHGEILGVHVASQTAIESISEASALMELEATIEELANLTHVHPAVNESIWDAALVAYDKFKKTGGKK